MRRLNCRTPSDGLTTFSTYQVYWSKCSPMVSSYLSQMKTPSLLRNLNSRSLPNRREEISLSKRVNLQRQPLLRLMSLQMVARRSLRRSNRHQLKRKKRRQLSLSSSRILPKRLQSRKMSLCSLTFR
jgi:hypothetical protein